MQITTKIALSIILALFSTFFIMKTTNSTSLQSQFEKWRSQFNIKYSTPFEQYYRKKIFMDNVEKVNLHNSDPYRTYDMGINQFAGITEQQFKAIYLNDINVSQLKVGKNRHVEFSGDKVDDIDWVALGAVTKVKNQGQCAASWAFSASGALQGISKISYGELKTFSDQQLLDCSGSLCSCSGGFVDMAFRYAQSHGICEQSVYPYVQEKQPCKTMGCTFKISDYDFVDNCNGLGKVIGIKPVSVAVDAANWALYKSGIFSNCGTKVNYMALLVGVIEGNWKVKNSLGTGWGQQGYIRLAPGNTCGVCFIGLYAIK